MSCILFDLKIKFMSIHILANFPNAKLHINAYTRSLGAKRRGRRTEQTVNR
jgi:hypothetical protein